MYLGMSPPLALDIDCEPAKHSDIVTVYVLIQTAVLFGTAACMHACVCFSTCCSAAPLNIEQYSFGLTRSSILDPFWLASLHQNRSRGTHTHTHTHTHAAAAAAAARFRFLASDAGFGDVGPAHANLFVANKECRIR
jgi:hypothetical protein